MSQVNNADELAEYLQKEGDHYFRADWTIGAYKDDDDRWVYWENYKGYCECSTEQDKQVLCPHCDFYDIEDLIDSANIDFPMEIPK